MALLSPGWHNSSSGEFMPSSQMLVKSWRVDREHLSLGFARQCFLVCIAGSYKVVRTTGFAVALQPASGLMATQMAQWWWYGSRSRPFPHSRRRLPKAVQLHALCLQHPPLRPPQCGGLHPHPYLAAFRVSTQRRWLWLKQVCWLLHVSCVWQVMWAFTQYSRRLLNRLHLMPAAAICGRCCTCFLQTCYMSLMSLLLYFGAVSWIPPLL